MNAQEILERAADIVDERWQQRRFTGRNGERCADAALLEAATGTAACLNLPAEYWEARDTLTAETGHPYLMAWNDAPGRSRYDVSDAMRRAAKTLANAGTPR